MQPKTHLAYTTGGLKKIYRKVQMLRQCDKERATDPTFALALPQEIGLKLTNRCNLRCTHCFQWDATGYHHTLDKKELGKEGDLDIEIVRELLHKTSSINSSLYLWGGEPTLYAHWNELVAMLAEDPRDTVICTNGVTLQHQMDSLVKISECLTVLISIEGPEAVHDRIRGKNTYRKIMDNLQSLLKLQREGVFKGILSVEAVISDDLIPHLYDFCNHFEALQINTLFLNFPWYIPENVAAEMDEFFQSRYGWMNTDRGKANSWHSFDFRISSALVPELKAQIERIMQKTWNIRLRFHPELKDDMVDFIEGSTQPAQQKTRCLGISSRIDLLPGGKVTPCKKFPEFVVGNLNESSLEEVWQGDGYKRFRGTHGNELMSICSKCEILYANGV